MYITAARIYHLKLRRVMIVKQELIIHFAICKQRSIVLFVLFDAQIVNFIMLRVFLIKEVPRINQ
jgi:hypothetical protein